MTSTGCTIALVYACFVLLFNKVCLVVKGGVLRAQMREEGGGGARDAEGCRGRRGVDELERKKQ